MDQSAWIVGVGCKAVVSTSGCQGPSFFLYILPKMGSSPRLGRSISGVDGSIETLSHDCYTNLSPAFGGGFHSYPGVVE